MTLALVLCQKLLTLAIRRLQKWQQKHLHASADSDLDAQVLENAIQALVALHLAMQYQRRRKRSKTLPLHAQ